MGKGYVYTLKSEKNGRYYIGNTKDMGRLFEEHCNGKVKATRYLCPLSIAFS
jgi:predicted GIY-YIG superfamily endonuclease